MLWMCFRWLKLDADVAVCYADSAAPAAPVSLEELAECLAALGGLRLRAERQPALLALQAAAQCWQDDATAALSSCSGDGPQPVPHVHTVEDLLASGTAPPLATQSIQLP